MREIVLLDAVRCFERITPSSLLLRNTTTALPAGTCIHVGETITMVYDHRDLHAVPFIYCGSAGFFLLSEVERSLKKPRGCSLKVIKGGRKT